MAPNNSESTACQSCGKPLSKPEDFGTNADGNKNDEYCSHCFQSGKFTYPNITMEEMIEISAVLMMSLAFMDEAEATSKAKKTIPKLKRWAK